MAPLNIQSDDTFTTVKKKKNNKKSFESPTETFKYDQYV